MNNHVDHSLHIPILKSSEMRLLYLRSSFSVKVNWWIKVRVGFYNCSRISVECFTSKSWGEMVIVQCTWKSSLLIFWRIQAKTSGKSACILYYKIYWTISVILNDRKGGFIKNLLAQYRELWLHFQTWSPQCFPFPDADW